MRFTVLSAAVFLLYVLNDIAGASDFSHSRRGKRSKSHSEQVRQRFASRIRLRHLKRGLNGRALVAGGCIA
jgi:hypothetical protein